MRMAQSRCATALTGRPGRGFDGRLAQLAIYDAALTESNVCPKPHFSCP